MTKIFQKRLSVFSAIVIVALYLSIFSNSGFWVGYIEYIDGIDFARVPLLLGMLAILALFFIGILTLFSFSQIFKPVVITAIVISSGINYFIHQYGIAIDKTMIQNVFETDFNEAAELLNWKMFVYVTFLGIIPSICLAGTKIIYPRGIGGMTKRAILFTGVICVAIILLVLTFKTLAPTFRQYHELRYRLTPMNLIQATQAYASIRLRTPTVVKALGRDAIKGRTWIEGRKPVILVIVVGETARASSFSLNGYANDTNPLLSRQKGLINFTNVQSCGTATAVSLPCLFSTMGRTNYDALKARGQEGLLDVLSHAGLRVIWRSNNSGCKGVCDRVEYQDLSIPEPGAVHCSTDECYDERLLVDFPDIIGKTTNDTVLVLHQKGSHGPAYSLRYPERFAKFGPACTTTDFQQCTREEIVAAYDNTILYTDYILSRTIAQLEAAANVGVADTAMLYVSDHGESLGERNMYLHGAPYLIAPREQTHVPMVMWMSSAFSSRFRIDQQCLNARRQQEFTHDNFFHSVLGMLDINSATINPALDIFNPCVRKINQ
ncbi:phosphoethanolamine transferase [Massilia oculi]|jgi:lipid A ethanolaminephosphotransferase|uniref:Phosphoethanolamine transferase n=1 Tax=Massilia oculi TaxID=945844 RepID=A0A2S2DQA5_9BURK|nr:phosphoethanolamine--lipid A transferase [Massilia oculi]AWL07544.1 phosphoethanolamine transferase [Massilia oculi]